jgi:CheY-like chemotaxis protein
MNNLKKILLIEDEPDIREIARIALEDIGHFTVKYCSSGEEALRNAGKFSPDLILLDMMMPGMNGITTLSELRKKPSTQNIPVIFMTAINQASESIEYKNAGALDVINKPFDPMRLASMLQSIWDKHHG